MDQNNLPTNQDQTPTALQPQVRELSRTSYRPNSNARRSYTPPSQPVTLNPFSLVLFLSAVVFVIITVIAYVKSQSSPQLKIDNFAKVYPNTPKETRESSQIILYRIAEMNRTSDKKLPKSGAVIRDGSNTSEYNESTEVYTDKFIVDIESLQQSYSFIVYWSPVKDNPNIDTYTTNALCPTKDQLIYPAFECQDGYERQEDADVLAALPIEVAYYTDNYAYFTHYTITAKRASADTGSDSDNNGDNDNSNNLIIEINDYTGGNYEAAMKKLKETKIDLDKYKIQYNNLVDDGVGRAPGGE